MQICSPRKRHLPNVILFAVGSFQAPSYDSVLQTAQSIAQQAHDLAYDPNYMSPFAQFACDNGLNVRGTYRILTRQSLLNPSAFS